MQGQGLKLNTKAFVAQLIEDMRKTAQTEGMVLDMQRFARRKEDGCHICAGGSAVVHGLDGAPDSRKWTEEQWRVAYWCDCIRLGFWDGCDGYGFPVPKEAQENWHKDMKDVGPNFFPAWERFRDGWPEDGSFEDGCLEDGGAA